MLVLSVFAISACSGPAVPPTPTPDPNAAPVTQNHNHGETSITGQNARLVTKYGGPITVLVTANPAKPQPTQPFNIDYQLSDSSNKPLGPGGLRVTHEHPMHLIVVSSDLKQFAHIHPVPASGGHYVVSDTLPAPGTYLMYNEFVTSAGTTQIERDPVTTDGAPQPAAAASLVPTLGQPQEVDGLTVVMTTTQKERRRLPTTYTLSVRHNGTSVSTLEPYLGAACHVVIISEDTRQFAHTHGEVAGMSTPVPMNMSDMANMNMPAPPAHFGPKVQFTHTFMQAGNYRIWVQFGYEGRVITVANNVTIEK